MSTLYTFWDNKIPYRTSVHFLGGLMNSATKACCGVYGAAELGWREQAVRDGAAVDLSTPFCLLEGWMALNPQA